MRKLLLTAGLAAVILTACGQAREEKSEGKKEEISNGLPVIEQAEQAQTVSRSVRFPQDEAGNSQTQTVTYQGSQFKKLVIERVSPTSSELQEAIREAGTEEAQRALNESLNEDRDYAQAKDLPGFSSTISLISDRELKLTSSYDFDRLDIEQAADMPYFKNLNLRELIKLTPEEYINNLLASGGTEDRSGQ